MRPLMTCHVKSAVWRRNMARDAAVLSQFRLLSDKRKGSDAKPNKKYSDTLTLPKTGFPLSMKNVASRELDVQKDCKFEDLYAWQQERNTGKTFILHDGPPYANGKPHVGHAINKILKDITNRYQVLRGSKVNYMPGWDCHGLPIELKALKRGANQKLTPLQIRDRARKFAENAIREQMKSFKRWGVMSDWENCYYTFNPAYEAKELDVFYDMYEKGLIYIGMLPVYWSPSSKTCLAESELEYNNNHVSTAVYVKCHVTDVPRSLSQYMDEGSRLNAVIWTTTPWSLPANQAICYNSNIRYVLLKDDVTGEVFMCEDSFSDKLGEKLQKTFSKLTTFSGNDLHGAKYKHPLTNEILPFHHADHVIPDKGTGLVHTAPSHGHDDYNLAKKLGIEITNLLDDDGRFTDLAGTDLAGKRVGDVETENTVLSCLGENVLHTEKFTHSYPYDWRTKKPVIIRVSRQWFVDTQAIRERAKECLNEIEIKPERSTRGMMIQLETRPYWCISRQRSWGLPIPVFYHRETKQPLLTRKTFAHIRNLVENKGSDCWWALSDEELLPTSLLQQEGLGKTEDYERGQDILDIWFDSGSSWATVLGAEKQADIYMEGLDQFGGWFQTSLLTSVALQNKAPYKKLVVHGFTVDEDGGKMSKSLGNVVDPDVVIHGGKNKQKEPAFGADVLRWWAAMSCLQTTTTIGNNKLSLISNDIFEMRKTLRFLLGNISVKNSEKLLDYESLWPQDKHMLYKLYELAQRVTDLYENLAYTQVLQTVDKFCKNEVSRFYSTLIKDRCYCSSHDGVDRRSTLTTQYHLLHVIIKSLAPIIPHLTEELYHHYPSCHQKNGIDSIFKDGWFDLPPEWNDEKYLHSFSPVLDIRDHFLDIIGEDPSQEFDVMIHASSLLHEKLSESQKEPTSMTSPLCEVLQAASTTLLDKPPTDEMEDVQVVNGICQVHLNDGYKNPEKYVIVISDTSNVLCGRCRRYTAPTANGSCDRCLAVMSDGWE